MFIIKKLLLLRPTKKKTERCSLEVRLIEPHANSVEFASHINIQGVPSPKSCHLRQSRVNCILFSRNLSSLKGNMKDKHCPARLLHPSSSFYHLTPSSQSSPSPYKNPLLFQQERHRRRRCRVTRYAQRLGGA